MAWIMYTSTRMNNAALSVALNTIANRFMPAGNTLYSVIMPSWPPRSKAMPVPTTVIHTNRLMVISSVEANEK